MSIFPSSIHNLYNHMARVCLPATLVRTPDENGHRNPKECKQNFLFLLPRGETENSKLISKKSSQNLLYIQIHLLYNQSIFTLKRPRKIWFLKKSTLNPDLPYNWLLYKRFLLYNNCFYSNKGRKVISVTWV